MPNKIQLNQSHVIDWLRSAESPSVTHPKSAITLVDLFSGCGGMTLGAVKAAHEQNIQVKINLAIDFNAAALETYTKNFSNYNPNAINTDILEYFPQDLNIKLTKIEKGLSKSIGKVDILLAGPPCQGHSDLNNSTRRNDPRNKLYLSTLRAIKSLEPKLAIIENVPTVVHSQEKVTQKATSYLSNLGYSVKELTIDFQTLSVPQTRRRHVIIAKKSDAPRTPINLEASNEKPTLQLGDFIKDLEDIQSNKIEFRSGNLSAENIRRMNYLFDNNLYNLPDEQRPPCHRNKAHSYNSIYGRLYWDKPAQTITSGFGSMGQGRYIHPRKKRTINPREAARIQGFPDYFSFDHITKVTELRKMIANAVPPQLTYCITKLFLQGEI
ncbi:DNA cytosine methyltransferase [Agaribacterium haliotis]|uniref:DNA cytosine methyltransferase n=1 Tax=Agaribacterium haliotis TaxID=2013869 RepID=UPI000BB53083|nr:DNA cytosine methyltransferase [Agaribacterium haliotis]